MLFPSPLANRSGILIGMGLHWEPLRQRIPGWAAALVFGTLPALALPAPSWWWLAWFGVVPLLLVVRAAPTSWAGAARASCGVGGFVLTARQAATEALTATLAGRRADLLVNVDAPAPGGGTYKSSVLVDEHGSVGSYRKTRLVPFGEYVPLRTFLGWITRHSKAAAEDRQRGAGPAVLNVGELGIGPLISYEMTFSDLARREAQLGAGLLVYQSSTSSFQGSWAQPQLAGQPAVRAVEVGRPAVHVGLSGDSSAFDARGRRLAWCPSDFRGVTVVSVPLGSSATLYQRLGDWVPVTAFVVLAGVVGLAVLRGHRSRARDRLP